MPWTVGHKELRQHFEQFGRVSMANVIFNKATGLSKAFGFVQFSNKDGFEAAMLKPNQVLEGNTLLVQPATKP